jgi:glycosyltransferase involved in cell wall biosynthesis
MITVSSNTELVSIVLCTYNGEMYLKEQLNSIQQQTYANIEIIIVDDYSTDNTYSIALSAQTTDLRIKCFQNNSNLGYNKNFINAFQYARGNYIAIADQDDIWELNKIEYMMAHLWTQPNVLLAHSKSARFNDGESIVMKKLHLRKSFTGNDVRKLLLFNPISGHNIIFKKKLLPQIVQAPQGLYYDWWINIVAASNGSIEATEKVLTYQRIHSENATVGERKSILLKHQVINTLPLLLKCEYIKKEHRLFGETLLKKFKTLHSQKFSVSLFLFLLKNAPVVFFFKRRRFPWISYLKEAYKISKANYRI